MMKNLFLSIVSLLVLSNCHKSKQNQSSDIVKKSYLPDTYEVNLILLDQVSFKKELVSNGYLEALEKSDLRFNVNKKLYCIYAKNGNYFTKGKILAYLDDHTFQLKLNKAKLDALQVTFDFKDLQIRRGFDLSLNTSYTVNQQANTFVDAYGRFLNQQMVSVQFHISILDWGERKGTINTANLNKDVIDIELQQNEESYKQNATLSVLDFNIQKDLVDVALKTRDIANESYALTKKRFLSANLDFLNLTTSRNAWQQANENYIIAL